MDWTKCEFDQSKNTMMAKRVVLLSNVGDEDGGLR